MSIFRSYFEKNNIIQYNSLVNTGRNEISEFFYGGEDKIFSRMLLKLDLSGLQSRISSKDIILTSATTHTLKMVNTSFFDKELLGQDNAEGKERAYGFHLVAFPLNKDWTEGNGYDYSKVLSPSTFNTYSTGPSNWFSGTTTSGWGSNTAATGSTSSITIQSQYFEKGNENLSMDITGYVNSILTGSTTDYGLGIAFSGSYEQLSTDKQKFVGFFSRNTSTYYEPFLETVYNDIIDDDRSDFFLDKDNTLYLYTNLGTQPTNLDFNPTGVTVFDYTGGTFSSYTATDITQVTRGIYSIELHVPSDIYPDTVMFYDEWSGVTVNGVTRPPIRNRFTTKDPADWYEFGVNEKHPQEVAFQVWGIRRNEKIKAGDIRKVYVNAKKAFTINQKELVDGLYYRIFVRQGTQEINIIDWHQVNKTFNSNYFLVDTSWMIPNDYYIDLKMETNREVKTYPSVINFSIVNSLNEPMLS